MLRTLLFATSSMFVVMVTLFALLIVRLETDEQSLRAAESTNRALIDFNHRLIVDGQGNVKIAPTPTPAPQATPKSVPPVSHPKSSNSPAPRSTGPPVSNPTSTPAPAPSATPLCVILVCV